MSIQTEMPDSNYVNELIESAVHAVVAGGGALYVVQNMDELTSLEPHASTIAVLVATLVLVVDMASAED